MCAEDVAESGAIGGAAWGARRAAMAASAERTDCDAPGEFLAEVKNSILFTYLRIWRLFSIHYVLFYFKKIVVQLLRKHCVLIET